MNKILSNQSHCCSPMLRSANFYTHAPDLQKYQIIANISFEKWYLKKNIFSIHSLFHFHSKSKAWTEYLLSRYSLIVSCPGYLVPVQIARMHGLCCDFSKTSVEPAAAPYTTRIVKFKGWATQNLNSEILFSWFNSSYITQTWKFLSLPHIIP